MTNKSFKLDDIKDAAEKQYAHTEIELSEDETVRLINPLQLSEAQRKALREVPEGDDATLLDFYRNTVKVISDTEAGADRLLSEFGENLAYFAKLLEFYNEEVEAGEA